MIYCFHHKKLYLNDIELQSIYEIILGRKLYKANFRKKIMDFVEETGNIQTGEANRPSKYYRWNGKME